MHWVGASELSVKGPTVPATNTPLSCSPVDGHLGCAVGGYYE